MPQNFLLVSSTLVAILIFLGLKRFNDRRRRNYPPGPPPSGFVTGHMKDIPDKKPWVTYNKWAKEYGFVYFYPCVVESPLTTVVVSQETLCIWKHWETTSFYSIVWKLLTSYSRNVPGYIRAGHMPKLEKCSFFTIFILRPISTHTYHYRTGWSFHPGKYRFFTFALNTQ